MRVHNNSLEHIVWMLPLTLVGGMFAPRFTVACASVVLVGRSLYAYGYFSKYGPTSHIREMGAITLNVAEILLIGSLFTTFLRYKTGTFFTNRKIYKRFTQTFLDKRVDEIKKEANQAGQVWRQAHNKRAMAPMHPEIMKRVQQFNTDDTLTKLPEIGELSPDARRRILNIPDDRDPLAKAKNRMPNISNYQ
jgi:hypothetical protein